MDLLWWDRSTGIGSSMLAVEAIDYHPLLVGAKIQSIPVCRASIDCWVGIFTGEVTPITPVQREVPSWSGTSLCLTAYEHGLTESKCVGVTGWMHLDLEVWITHAHTMTTNIRPADSAWTHLSHRA